MVVAVEEERRRDDWKAEALAAVAVVAVAEQELAERL